MEPLVFLTKSQVLFLHQDLVEDFGGSHGLRDEGLLESALEMPKSGFGGEYFHKSLYEMAAAYLFHLVKNHPFIDGNKRIGLACADVFLAINDIELTVAEDEAYEFTMRVASENVAKEEISIFFQKNSKALDESE
ncbi:MAG: type II toxin-antitoxin system death-on-curing family toxin [Candidatus Sericytochromatia bacterium]